MGDCNDQIVAVSTIAYSDNATNEKTTDDIQKAKNGNVEDQGIITDEERNGAQQNLRNNILGFGLGILTSLFVAVGTSCTQALQGSVPDLELAAIRGFGFFICVFPYFVIKRQLPTVKRKSIIWLLFICVNQCGYAIFLFLAVRYIPLGVAGALLRVALLLSITVFARLVLKETITIVKLLSVVLSILAVFLVIQPSFIFGTYNVTAVDLTKGIEVRLRSFSSFSYKHWSTTVNSTREPEPDNDEVSTLDEVLGYLMMIASGLCGALTTITVKSKFSDINPLILNFWCAVSLTVVPLILSLIIEFDDLTFPTDFESISLVVAQAFASGLSFIAAFKGMKLTTAILITLAMSMQIFFLIISQYTVLNDISPGKGNWVELLGAGLVVVGAFIPPVWETITTKCRSRSKSNRVTPNN